VPELVRALALTQERTHLESPPTMKRGQKCDVIVVGAGHAGVETALATCKGMRYGRCRRTEG
jgi:NADH dehydrogenase FAD-containing subunit